MCKPLPESIGDYRLDEPDPHAFDEEPYGEDEPPHDDDLVETLWLIGTGKMRKEWSEK